MASRVDQQARPASATVAFVVSVIRLTLTGAHAMLWRMGAEVVERRAARERISRFREVLLVVYRISRPAIWLTSVVPYYVGQLLATHRAWPSLATFAGTLDAAATRAEERSFMGCDAGRLLLARERNVAPVDRLYRRPPVSPSCQCRAICGEGARRLSCRSSFRFVGFASR